MNPTVRRAALLSLIAAAVIACSPAPTVAPSASPAPTPSPTMAPASPTAAAVVNDAANGISFARPASWTRWLPNAHNPINDGPLIYLSTDPLLPTCATTPQATPNPADRSGSCLRLAARQPRSERGARDLAHDADPGPAAERRRAGRGERGDGSVSGREAGILCCGRCGRDARSPV